MVASKRKTTKIKAKEDSKIDWIGASVVAYIVIILIIITILQYTQGIPQP